MASRSETSWETGGVPDSVPHVATVGGRLAAIDALRGIVMVLMVLDHTRDFLTDPRIDATDLATTTMPLFLTRWVTHFCAPNFVFLAGTSAYLMRALGKRRTAGELARFLASRGLFLMLLELTLVRLVWFFNWDPRLMFLQVIWAIGLSWVFLAILVACRVPAAIVGLLGGAIVLTHGLLTFPPGSPMVPRPLWSNLVAYLFRPGMYTIAPGFNWFSAYPVIPWFGIMALGYVFGGIMVEERPRRVRLAAGIGLAACLSFLALRASGLYGDPQPWKAQDTAARSVIAFLNCQKYPPSLLYTLMTLGPGLLVLASLDLTEGLIATHGRQAGAPRRFLVTLGRVPLFYYLLQWPVVHGMAIVLSVLNGPSIPWFDWQNSYPPGYGYSLPFVYLMWALAVAILYVPSRWFAGVRRRRRDATWLSYL